MTALLLTALMAAAPPAPAPPEVPSAALTKDAAPAADDDRHWYGWQTMLADVGTAGVVIVAVKLNVSGNSVAYLGAALFAGSGPAIHFSHGRNGTGLLDLLLRVGLPLGSALGLGLLTSTSSCSECFLGGAVFGLGLGVVGASILDATLLSWETIGPLAPVTPAISFYQGRDGQQHAAPALMMKF
ncbi:MAG TPA: hypothetical protein VH083_28710 [Myxococcales bacterium]|jgi:hypothetical protein|nr:hypothetical protein [Myxococcales bacterium]